MKLYEIDQAIQAILDGAEVDAETGELLLNTEELEALQMERDAKLEGVALAIKNLSAEAAAICEEEKKLAERRKAVENKAERLKSWLAIALDGGKLETPRVRVSVRPGGVSTMVNDVSAVVDWYNDTRKALLDEHTEEASAEFDRITELMQLEWHAPTVSKAGLKKLLKDYEIPGVGLFTGAASLVIK
jgi:seryl-tRNA synthetase